MSRKILCVWGTRPETVKLAPLIRALRRRKEFALRTCATAQQRGLLDQALAGFGLRPDDDLDLMRPDQSPEATFRRVLQGVTRVLARRRPDLVVVQGDTTTTLAASLAAFYERVPVAHVEAGLRTGDLGSPFPEEAHRALADRIAGLCLAPTPTAKRRLLQEGVPARRIYVTGNTAVDALRLAGGRDGPQDRRLAEVFRDPGVLLATIHRRENLGRPLRRVFAAFRAVVERHPVRILFAVHSNPGVRAAARTLLRHERIRVVPPMSHRDMLFSLSRCRLVLTDSGGLQEEAPAFHKPVLVLRDRTDRPEALEAGFARLVGTEPEGILKGVARALGSPARVEGANPFGDGHASERIVRALLHYFGRGPRPLDWTPAASSAA